MLGIVLAGLAASAPSTTGGELRGYRSGSQDERAAPPATRIPTGRWEAWLDSPGGRLPFVIDAAVGPDGLQIDLVNGSGRTAASRIAFDRDALTLWFDPYESHIDARLSIDGDR